MLRTMNFGFWILDSRLATLDFLKLRSNYFDCKKVFVEATTFGKNIKSQLLLH